MSSLAYRLESGILHPQRRRSQSNFGHRSRAQTSVMPSGLSAREKSAFLIYSPFRLVFLRFTSHLCLL